MMSAKMGCAAKLIGQGQGLAFERIQSDHAKLRIARLRLPPSSGGCGSAAPPCRPADLGGHSLPGGLVDPCDQRVFQGVHIGHRGIETPLPLPGSSTNSSTGP